ncbi:WD40-repeat-containing domain protein [Catenaria anguillulae PL171]|uniref:WD40-repeat-containing domain protein n=1 Tax=Catenaria anguillulae PL171 TaxID=765915 RepID=A0A1Y2HJS8_9FUNG|nr:WD40-repeat-containing domain protein [Catenaria anguillulae PL171]
MNAPTSSSGSSLAVSNPNNVKVYRVGGSSRNVTLPKWLASQSKSSLKKDAEWRNRIELIQDFEFPQASYRIKLTRDGKYAMASGVYKPQLRVYDFSEMSMKFERHSDVENVNFVILSEDWTKSVHLQADRTIEFHSQFGRLYTTRIPKFGRDIQYHFPSCDVLVGGASSDVYRLNLEQGRFLNPLVTDSPGINKVEINPANQLWCFGGDDGHVEFWDPRVRSRIARLDVVPSLHGFLDDDSMRPEISALSFRNDGLHLGVGTSSGHVLLYDLRSPTPRLVKDHQYGLEIRHVHWHDRSDNVISADRKIVRMWNNASGKLFTSIEPPNDINDICVVPDSGLLFIAGEAVQMHTYLVPDLGPSPRFAAFLDNLTEEMAESQGTVLYDNYKFVTRNELKKLGLEMVVGTPAAKAYMHGYFIDARLYERARVIANPFAFDEFKKQMVKEKLEAKRASRITTKAKPAKAKVNQALAEKLGGTDAVDDRFKKVFEDDEFYVDETSETFKLLNPVQSDKKSKARDAVYEDSDDEDLRFKSVRPVASDEEDEDAMSVDEASDSESDKDEVRIPDVEPELPPMPVSASKKKKRGGADDEDRIVRPRAPAPSRKFKAEPKPKGPSMVELQTAESLRRKQTFAARVASESEPLVANSRSTSGGMEMRFEVPDKKQRGADRGAERGGRQRRRG